MNLWYWLLLTLMFVLMTIIETFDLINTRKLTIKELVVFVLRAMSIVTKRDLLLIVCIASAIAC